VTSVPPDEFEWIVRLRPLTRGAAGALGLTDDAAIVPSRAGFDLVVSKDAIVEGVHTLVGEAPDIIARRALRTALSDLAAKAAEPFGYFLMTAWPADRDWTYRRAFIDGLAQDGERFDVALLGGDTVATPGPLTVSVTVMGWAPAGRTVLRSGARAGDVLVVCGPIGDGWLGLKAARGEAADEDGLLAAHYRTPEPMLSLRGALRRHARAGIDVSDGLLADSEHLAEASGLGLAINLERAPLSPGAAQWLSHQANPDTAILSLAAGGDDYAIACAVDPGDVTSFSRMVAGLGVCVAPAGVFEAAPGLRVSCGGSPIGVGRKGWRH
jgi:thiamine-monophosphate kinase